jgi:hypothetical protein
MVFLFLDYFFKKREWKQKVDNKTVKKSLDESFHDVYEA